MKPHFQVCPRSFESSLRQNKWDIWRTGTWGSVLSRWIENWYHNGWLGDWLRANDLRLRRAGHGRFANRWWPSPYKGGTVWQIDWQPRTCSYCGGVHPDDAIRLHEEGWIVESTTKNYKFYLKPPGAGWAPVPPVKVYLAHFDSPAIKRANIALANARKNNS